MIVDLDDDISDRFSFLRIDKDQNEITDRKRESNSNMLIREASSRRDDHSMDMTIGKAHLVLKGSISSNINFDDDDPIASSLNYLSKETNEETVSTVMDFFLDEVLRKERTEWVLFCLGYIYERNRICILNYLLERLNHCKESKKLLLSTVLCITRLSQKEKELIATGVSELRKNKPKIMIISEDDSNDKGIEQNIALILLEAASRILEMISIVDNQTSIILVEVCASDCIFSICELILSSNSLLDDPKISAQTFILLDKLLDIQLQWNEISKRPIISTSVNLVKASIRKHQELCSQNMEVKKLLSTYCSYINQFSIYDEKSRKDLARNMIKLIPKILNDLDACKNLKIVEPDVQATKMNLYLACLICILGRLPLKRSTELFKVNNLEKVLPPIIKEFDLEINFKDVEHEVKKQ